MGYKTMSERVGVTVQTAEKSVRDLIAKKLIKTWKRGGAKTVDGQPKFFANEYVFTDNQLFGNWPMIVTKQTKFLFADVVDDVNGFYYQTMWAMVDHDELRRYMTPSEYKECVAANESDGSN